MERRIPMSRVAEYYGLDVAFVIFIALFTISRVVSRSALKLLDDDSKIRLVDAKSRSNWWYLPLIPILFLLYWRLSIGALTLFVYVIAGMTYDVRWHLQNQMPKRFVTRVVAANGLVLVGYLSLALGYVAETV